jgi:hypothetical protein
MLDHAAAQLPIKQASGRAARTDAHCGPCMGGVMTLSDCELTYSPPLCPPMCLSMSASKSPFFCPPDRTSDTSMDCQPDCPADMSGVQWAWLSNHVN